MDHTNRFPASQIRYDYQNVGCSQAGASAPMMGIVGCTAVWQGWSLFFCGARIERTEPDFLDASVPLSGLGYPRTLVPATTVNGLQQPELSCGEPLVCRHMCRNFAKSAREGNLGQPLGCALCEPVCPNDVVTVMVDAVDALKTDIYTAVRLFLTCFGPGGPVACVCNVMMLMKPCVAMSEHARTLRMRDSGFHVASQGVDRKLADRRDEMQIRRCIRSSRGQGRRCGDESRLVGSKRDDESHRADIVRSVVGSSM